MSSLVRNYAALGQYEDAIKLSKKVLSIYMEVEGAEHESMLSCSAPSTSI